MDLRAGSPAVERRTWSRSLRGTILAGPSPSCAHDDDRLRFPPVSPAQNSKAGKKESTGRRRDRRSAVRQAILELIARPPPQRCPHCRKWICNERRPSKSAKVVLVFGADGLHQPVDSNCRCAVIKRIMFDE